MKNNSTPDASGSSEWNSDEPAIGDLSCEQLARLGTTFLGVFRMARSCYTHSGPLEAAKVLHMFLGNQIKIVESGIIPADKQDMVDDAMELAIIAISMAGAAATGKMDPRHAAGISVQMIEGMTGLIKKTLEEGGAISESDMVIAKVRVPEEAKEGYDMVDISLSVQPVPKRTDDFTKKVAAIVRESHQNPSNGQAGDN